MAKPVKSTADWQLRCEKTRQRLSHLLDTSLWTDCKFLVGDEEPEIISAHKFVLAMSSPVFETMFYGSMPEEDVAIRVPDVQPAAFRTMLKCLYTDQAQMETYQEASEVYYAARKYMLPFIQKKCVYHLKHSIEPKNACFAHELASLFDETDLLNAALKTFKTETKDVLKEGSFYEAHIKTVSALFSQPKLAIDSELDLFNALEKYASDTMGLKVLKRSLTNQNADSSDSSPSKKPRIEDETIRNESNELEETKMSNEFDAQSEDEKRLISDVRHALTHIRFLTMSPQEFATAARSVLMTDEEAFAIMLNLAGVPASVPAGISASTMPRFYTSEEDCWPPMPASPTYASPSASTASTSQTLSPAQGQNATPNAGVENVFEGICTFSVYNFKTRKRAVKSRLFSTDVLDWRVIVVPGMERNQKTLGVCVECVGITEDINCSINRDKKRAWACNAHVHIELIHNVSSNLNYKRFFAKTYNKYTLYKARSTPDPYM